MTSPRPLDHLDTRRVHTTQGMEDVFGWAREGNAFQIRVWLDDTEHDMNLGYCTLNHPKSKNPSGVIPICLEEHL